MGGGLLSRQLRRSADGWLGADRCRMRPGRPRRFVARRASIYPLGLPQRDPAEPPRPQYWVSRRKNVLVLLPRYLVVWLLLLFTGAAMFWSRVARWRKNLSAAGDSIRINL